MEHRPHEEPNRGRLASSFDNVADHVRASLDRIVSHCAAEFDCPISLVSVAEPTQLRVLAATGIEAGEVPLQNSFCIHSIRSQQPLVVDDAREAPRFCRSEFVHADPQFRSYMAYALRHSRGC